MNSLTFRNASYNEANNYKHSYIFLSNLGINLFDYVKNREFSITDILQTKDLKISSNSASLTFQFSEYEKIKANILDMSLDSSILAHTEMTKFNTWDCVNDFSLEANLHYSELIKIDDEFQISDIYNSDIYNFSTLIVKEIKPTISSSKVNLSVTLKDKTSVAYEKKFEKDYIYQNLDICNNSNKSMSAMHILAKYLPFDESEIDFEDIKHPSTNEYLKLTFLYCEEGKKIIEKLIEVARAGSCSIFKVTNEKLISRNCNFVLENSVYTFNDSNILTNIKEESIESSGDTYQITYDKYWYSERQIVFALIGSIDGATKDNAKIKITPKATGNFKVKYITDLIKEYDNNFEIEAVKGDGSVITLNYDLDIDLSGGTLKITNVLNENIWINKFIIYGIPLNCTSNNTTTVPKISEENLLNETNSSVQNSQTAEVFSKWNHYIKCREWKQLTFDTNVSTWLQSGVLADLKHEKYNNCKIWIQEVTHKSNGSTVRAWIYQPFDYSFFNHSGVENSSADYNYIQTKDYIDNNTLTLNDNVPEKPINVKLEPSFSCFEIIATKPNDTNIRGFVAYITGNGTEQRIEYSTTTKTIQAKQGIEYSVQVACISNNNIESLKTDILKVKALKTKMEDIEDLPQIKSDLDNVIDNDLKDMATSLDDLLGKTSENKTSIDDIINKELKSINSEIGTVKSNLDEVKDKDIEDMKEKLSDVNKSIETTKEEAEKTAKDLIEKTMGFVNEIDLNNTEMNDELWNKYSLDSDYWNKLSLINAYEFSSITSDEISNVKGLVSVNNGVIKDVHEEMFGTKDKIGIKQSLTILDGKIDKTTGQLDGKLTTAENSITGLQNGVAKISSSLETTENSLKGLKTDITTVSSELSSDGEIKQSIKTLKQDRDTLKNNYSEVSQVLNGKDGELGIISTVSNLYTDMYDEKGGLKYKTSSEEITEDYIRNTVGVNAMKVDFENLSMDKDWWNEHSLDDEFWNNISVASMYTMQEITTNHFLSEVKRVDESLNEHSSKIEQTADNIMLAVTQKNKELNTLLNSKIQLNTDKITQEVKNLNGTIDEKTGTLEGKLTKVSTELTGEDGKSGIKNQVSVLETNTKTLSDGLTAIEERTKTVELTLDSENGIVASVENLQKVVNDEKNGLVSRLDKVNLEINGENGITSQVSSLETNLGKTNGKLAEYKTATEEITEDYIRNTVGVNAMKVDFENLSMDKDWWNEHSLDDEFWNNISVASMYTMQEITTDHFLSEVKRVEGETNNQFSSIIKQTATDINLIVTETIPNTVESIKSGIVINNEGINILGKRLELGTGVAIENGKLFAKDITADNLKAGSITVDKLNVSGDVSVENGELKVKKITSDAELHIQAKNFSLDGENIVKCLFSTKIAGDSALDGKGEYLFKVCNAFINSKKEVYILSANINRSTTQGMCVNKYDENFEYKNFYQLMFNSTTIYQIFKPISMYEVNGYIYILVLHEDQTENKTSLRLYRNTSNSFVQIGENIFEDDSIKIDFYAERRTTFYNGFFYIGIVRDDWKSNEKTAFILKISVETGEKIILKKLESTSSKILLPLDIAFIEEEKIGFWFNYNIITMNIDGTNEKIIYKTNYNLICYFKKKLYLIDSNSKNIIRINSDGSEKETVLIAQDSILGLYSNDKEIIARKRRESFYRTKDGKNWEEIFISQEYFDDFFPSNYGNFGKFKYSNQNFIESFSSVVLSTRYN